MYDIRNASTLLKVVGTAALAGAGGCVGYLVAIKELEDRYLSIFEQTLDEEIEKTRRYYATFYKDAGPQAFSELDEDEIEGGDSPVIDKQHIVIDKEALTSPEGRQAVMEAIRAEIEEQEDEAPVQENAFDADAEHQWAALLAQRGQDEPYVVSKEEYLRNDAQYETFNLTFFEKDGVLIDEDDDAIPDSNTVVGDANLQRFGMMSGNNNVVYVQNDTTEALFQITRSFQSSSEALFGVDEEDDHLEHSLMKRRRPRRDDG
jgi:hypothetical protein